ncbi:MAG: hypothetical protein QMC67_09995 [Candidatus Wallbacteria bacterium]
MPNFSVLPKAKKVRKGFTIVEFIIYGGMLGVLGFSAYEGLLYFQEWQCKKNVAAINEAIELQQSQANSTPIKELNDLKQYIKTTSKIIPRCPVVPGKFNYLLVPEEGKVRCSYHGVL